MSYINQPITADKPEEIKRGIERELRAIEDELTAVQNKGAYAITFEPPKGQDRVDNPLFGYIKYADGINWDPLGDAIAGFFIKGQTGWLRIATDI